MKNHNFLIKEKTLVVLKIFSLFLILSAFFYAAEYSLLRAERVEIKTQDGLSLIGTYYPVKDVKSPPAVVVLHMLGRNRGDWNKYARYLQRDGIAVLSLDIRGHGESTDFLKVSWRLFKKDDYYNLPEDLSAVYDFLLKEKKINKKKIALLGVAMGSNIALNYAVKNQDISSLVMVSPGLDYKGIKTEQAIIDYGERPVYLITTKRDPYSLSSSEILCQKARGKVKLDVYSYENPWSILEDPANQVNRAINSWFVQVFFDK